MELKPVENEQEERNEIEFRMDYTTPRQLAAATAISAIHSTIQSSACRGSLEPSAWMYLVCECSATPFSFGVWLYDHASIHSSTRIFSFLMFYSFFLEHSGVGDFGVFLGLETRRSVCSRIMSLFFTCGKCGENIAGSKRQKTVGDAGMQTRD